MIRIEWMIGVLLAAVIAFTGLMVHDHHKWKQEGVAQQKQADAQQFALDADTLAQAVARIKDANATAEKLRAELNKQHDAAVIAATQQEQQNAQAIEMARKSDAELLAENKQWMDRYHHLLTEPIRAQNTGNGIGILKQQLPRDLWEY